MHEIDFSRVDLQECLRSVNREFNEFPKTAALTSKGFGWRLTRNRSDEFNFCFQKLETES